MDIVNEQFVTAVPVTNLFEQKSHWDFFVRGRRIYLSLYPCGCGIRAHWTMDVPQSETLPPELASIASKMVDGDKPVKKYLNEWHYEPRWYQRLLFWRTLETELLKWVERSRSEMIANAKKLEDRLENAKQMLEKKAPSI